MPNFVDYSTENMSGTPVHTFVDASGQTSQPMYGEQADQLASSIDQYKQFQAASGGAPNQSLAPDPSAAPAVSSQAPAPAPGYSQADADAAAPKSPIGPPAPPSPSPEEQQARAVHAAAASGNPVAGQVDPGAYINRPVVTSGVSRAQLEQRAAGAVAVPKTGEETVEGAAPYDADAAEARAQANIDLRLAKQQQADTLAARAERDAYAFDQQAAIAATRIQHEQQKQQLIETGVQQDAETARAFRDQVAKQQVDPNRLFSGDAGAFRTIAAVIGQALGAFAAYGGGSPTVNGRRAAAGGTNFAKQIIDGAIDRDISAQEANIRSGQVNANNQLNDVYQRIGDLNQAKTVVRQMQTDYAGLQMRALAARDGSEDAANAFAQWDASNAADRAEQERKFIADSYGKHTVKVAQAFVSPQAGGSRAPTESEIQARIGTQQKLGELGMQGAKSAAELEHTQSETALNSANANKAQNPANNPAQAEYNKNAQFVDSAQASFSQALERAGGSYNPKTGRVDWKPGASVPGSGALARLFAPIHQSDEAKGLHAAISIAAPSIEKGVEGDAAGEAGIATIKENLTSGNEATRRAAFEALGQVLAGRRQSVDASGTPETRAQRAGQARQLAIDAQPRAAAAGRDE